jgi:hypothetical protein
MPSQVPEPRFPLGRTYTSLGVAHLGINVLQYLKRHQSGDWGKVTEEQKQANESALISGGSLISHYDLKTPDGNTHTAFVFTEEGRGRTVILLPPESWFLGTPPPLGKSDSPEAGKNQE